MTQGFHCPSSIELADYLVGKLDSMSLQITSEHVESCALCQAQLESLEERDDSILFALKKSSLSGEADSELIDLLASAEGLIDEGSVDAPAGGTSVDEKMPAKIGQYEIVGRLGSGGMGTVYQAFHTKLRRHVALKVIARRRLNDPQAIDRFHREMEAVGRLDHHNLVRAHDAGEIEGRHFLVTELVEGVNLAKLMKQTERLQVADACEIARRIALGLIHAHHNGLIHRDIKPSNAMLTTEGEIKLLDLGLARLHDERPSESPRSGQVIGSPDFMAPEQATDPDSADARTDVYSLGCTLFYLLLGRPPYGAASGSSALARIRAHCTDPVPSVDATRDDVESRLSLVICQMMAKQPADRLADATQVAEALKPFCQGANLRHLITGGEPPRDGLPPNSQSQTASFPSSTATQRASNPRSRRARQWLPALLGVTLLVVSIFSIYGSQIALYLRGSGVVVVEGETSDVTLAIIDEEGETVLSFMPERQASPSIAAGRYHVDVVDRTDEVMVNPQECTVRRGERTTLTLVLKTPSLPDPTSNSAAEPSINPTDTQATHPEEPDEANSAESDQTISEPAGTLITNSIGMQLILIPSGEFTMGSPPDETRREEVEGPQHRVQIPTPFYLGVYEVTQAEYRRVVGSNPSFYSPRGGGAQWVRDIDTNACPVESVYWDDAVAFCARLSALPEEREAGRTYRLPTEAEWEYACRAGTTTPFHYGSSLSSRQANFKGSIPYGGATTGPYVGHPLPVGSYEPNAFGLYDMHGNAWEWCHDWYRPNYYTDAPMVAPAGPTAGSRHVIRGGGWGVSGMLCRSAHRNDRVQPVRYLYSLGFRVVVE